MKSFSVAATFIFLFIFESFSSGLPDQQPDLPDISNQRQLFVDYFLIERMDNVSLRLHHPHDEGEVLKFDKPWEGAFCGYSTVIKDGDVYRLYYRGLPGAGQDGSRNETTCYAESRDGINWTKPSLGLFEVNGTRDNNVILANAAPVTHNFSPFLDSNPGATPDQRFKALGGIRSSGLIPYVSADGIHWQRLQEEPVITEGAFDSQNVAFWSAAEGLYICYFRTWTTGEFKGYRTVSRTTSPDFIHWSKPVAMEFGDTPPEHLYTNQTHPYFRAPHIYVAIAARFFSGRQVLSEEQAATLNVNPKYFKDCSDAVFMTSRGGNRYDRTFMEGFIRPGIGLENWVSRSNYPALNVVQTGPAEMSVYVNRNYAQPTANLHRFSLRLDGFVSAHADYSGGELITKPFRFKGDSLEINFSTSAAGSIRLELQDECGNALPGFELENCPEMIGDEISRIVRWGGGANLAAIDQPVKVRFQIKDGDVFSFRFF